MRFSAERDRWMVLEEVPSTQQVASELVRSGGPAPPVVFARHQSAGAGRFDRPWHSEAGGSLTMSLILSEYAGMQRPWLLGMAVACAAAGALHCKLRWPNDLDLDGKKLGGILTHIVKDASGRRTPIIGVGVNLNITTFPPEIAERVTSLSLHRQGSYDPIKVALEIVARFCEIPEIEQWEDLARIWMLFDATPGKPYVMPNGETGTAIGVGPEGEMLCSLNGETRSVMAADALFMQPTSSSRLP